MKGYISSIELGYISNPPLIFSGDLLASNPILERVDATVTRTFVSGEFNQYEISREYRNISNSSINRIKAIINKAPKAIPVFIGF